jgi:hypothetical protein
MPNEVVFFHSAETGAPTLNNAAGSMIAVLDACLVNGFANTSASAVTVSSGVATLTINSHPYTTGKMLDVAGAAVAGVNGRKVCTVVDANTIRVPAPGVADGSVAGTVTVKRSPLGWAKPYSATNRAMYARTDPQATSNLLRVDDSAAGAVARVFMVEAATGVDAWTNKVPTEALLAGGQFWARGQNNATAKRWVLIGDSRTFYFLSEDAGNSWAVALALRVQAFGDLASFRAGDAHRAFIHGGQQETGASGFLVQPGPIDATGSYLSSGSAFAVSRDPSGVVFGKGLGALAPSQGSIPGGSNYPPYPSLVNNGFVLHSPVVAREGVMAGGYPLRGLVPGLAYPLANLQAVRTQFHLREWPDLAGTNRTYLSLSMGHQGFGSSETGMLFFDITGPWQ